MRAWTDDYANRLKKTLFDKAASRLINEPTRVFHAVSALQPRCIERARQTGAHVIIDSGAPHLLAGMRLLKEEYDLYGAQYMQPNGYWVEESVREFAGADCILVPSEYVKSSFVSQGVRENRLSIIPYGVDLETFHPLFDAKKIFRVLFVGNIYPHKGIRYLLEAFAMLNFPNSELVLCGHIMDSCANAMKMFLRPYHGKFRLIPGLPHNELQSLYASASVFVLPSISDGSAMVVYEAMACGLPAVVTAHTGSVIRDGTDGFVIPIRDSEALAGKLEFLYRNPEVRQEMGRAAAAWVREFTWEKYSERLVSLYFDLAEKCSS